MLQVQSNVRHLLQYLFRLLVNNRDHSNRKSLDRQFQLVGVDLPHQVMRRAHLVRAHNHHAITRATHLSRHRPHSWCQSPEEFRLRSQQLHRNHVRALTQLVANRNWKLIAVSYPPSRYLPQLLDSLVWFVRRLQLQLQEASGHRHELPKSR